MANWVVLLLVWQGIESDVVSGDFLWMDMCRRLTEMAMVIIQSSIKAVVSYINGCILRCCSLFNRVANINVVTM